MQHGSRTIWGITSWHSLRLRHIHSTRQCSSVVATEGGAHDRITAVLSTAELRCRLCLWCRQSAGVEAMAAIEAHTVAGASRGRRPAKVRSRSLHTAVSRHHSSWSAYRLVQCCSLLLVLTGTSSSIARSVARLSHRGRWQAAHPV
jgi:hypothetical protein